MTTNNLWLSNLQSGLSRNSNALIGFGSGLLSANNFADGLSAAGLSFRHGAGLDREQAQLAQQEQEQSQAKNSTLEWLRSNGYDDLVAGVEGGGLDMGTAWGEALRRRQPQGGAEPTSNMQDYSFLVSQGVDPSQALTSIFGGAGTDPTSAMQEYEYARTQGYEGDFTSWKTDIARAGATNVGMNNSEALAAGYADRMANSNSILSDPNITQSMTDVAQTGMNATPVVGNFLTSNERKMAEQAKRDFINAILRRESGAAIAESEFLNADRQYFPQPGDSLQVIEQKRRNREIAISGVSRAAGNGYQPPALASGEGWQVLGVE